MVEMEERVPTLCDCTMEVAELFASMPTGGADGGSLLDLLAVRLDASRDRVKPRRQLDREDGLSGRAVLC